MSWLVGLFLIAHGLIHALYFVRSPNDPKYPFTFDHPTAFGPSAKPIGVALVIVTIVGFLSSGLAVMGLPGFAAVWKPLILSSASLSLLLFGLFWHSRLIFGVAINVVLLIVFGVLRWHI